MGDQESPVRSPRGVHRVTPPPRSRPLSWWWLLVLVFALLAIALFAKGTGGPRAIGPSLPPTPSSAPVTLSVSAHPLGYSVPMEVRIPALSVRANIIRLGLEKDGTVQVPSNTVQVGWYDLGPSPGQVGDAVLLGHVDSYRGPGVFFSLRTLKSGQHVVVTRRDGRTVTFSVISVREYAKSAFPSQLVYGNHGVSELVLVTCGGPFDHRTGHYEANIVVTSLLVS